MRLFPGIHQISVKMGRETNLFLYLFTGRNSFLLDTGVAESPADDVVPHLREAGIKPTDLNLAVITHCDPDHFGGNSRLKALSPRTLLAAHHLDAAMASDPDMVMTLRVNEFRKDHGVYASDEAWKIIRAMMGSAVPIDVLMSGGEKLFVDNNLLLEVINTPGHTRGHIALFDGRDSAIFLGDAVFGKSVPGIDGKPNLPPTYRYVDEYVSTIKMLKNLKPKYIYSAHFPPMEEADAENFLQESQDFVDSLDHEIERIVSGSANPIPMRRIIVETNARLGICPKDAELDLMFPIAGHLEKLVRERKIRTLPTSPLTYETDPDRRR